MELTLAPVETELPRVFTRPARRLDLRRLVGDTAMLALLLYAGGRFLWWRTRQLTDVGPAGWSFWLVEAAAVISIVLTAVVVMGRRSARGTAPRPDGRFSLDVLIPVANEPLAMVRQTILAARRITYPATVLVCNDGRLAGNPHWRDVELLADELGVRCTTRTTGRPGKAGNMNAALRYSSGDLFLVLDADHVVTPDVGRRLLGWFNDPDVAFVTTSQQFHGGDEDPLNPEEPVFYQAIQPGRDASGLAFSTGNGVAYRRRAIDDVGGFSEWSIVEDLHTSMLLHDAGWSSVFHPGSVSIGVSPTTSAEYARQRLRWATDSLRILFFDCPLRRRGLSWRGRMLYTHVLATYLLVAVQIGFLLGPPAWILGRIAVMPAVPVVDQASHLLPWLAAVGVALVSWGGGRGAVRSWRTTFFLAPLFWVAIYQALRPRPRPGGATSKDRERRISALLVLIAVPTMMLIGSLVVAVVDPRSGGSDLAVVWAAMLCATAIGPLLRVGPRARWPRVVQTVVIFSALAVAGGAVATARLDWRAPGSMFASMRVDTQEDGVVVALNEFGDQYVLGPSVSAPFAAPAPAPDVSPAAATDPEPVVVEPVRARLEPGEGIYVGFTDDGVPYDLGGVGEWSDVVGAPRIVHWYQQWGSGETRFRGDWLAAVADAGAVPMVSWEAWAKPDGYASPDQELGRLADIASGRHDDYIRAWAQGAAEYGRPLLLRPFHEMNGYWYPWSVGENGNTAADFVAAWRHVHAVFDEAGATNVSWVWSINTLAEFDQGRGVQDYYPGDDVVDWVATSGFNWGISQYWSHWQTSADVFTETYELLAGFGKPVMFAEVGSDASGGDPVAWVSEAMATFAGMPQLHAVVWFDHSYDGTADFRLDADELEALRAAVARDPRLQLELTLVDS